MRTKTSERAGAESSPRGFQYPIELTWNGKADALLALSQPASGTLKSTEAPSENAVLNYDENQILIGDNLEVMRHLRLQKELSFDFVYIDPPYNSGQRFTFKDVHSRDSFSRECSWLTMMYPRLSCGRELMSQSGIMFVSIDDRQYAELLMMMYEIFGKENHLGTLKWRKKRKGSFLDQHLATTIEYIVVFAKNASEAAKLAGARTSETTRPVLNAANAISARTIRAGTPARCEDGVYKAGVYKNRTLELELLTDLTVRNGSVAEDVEARGRFRIAQALLDKTLFITRQFGLRRVVEEDESVRKHASDNATDWPTNEDADQELRKHFQQKVFTYPKPVGLIRNLLKMCPPAEGGTFRCLDFFAGTATLAEAVLEANHTDGAQRTYWCIQSREELQKPVESLGLFDISDIAVARAQKAHALYAESAPLNVCELKIQNASPQ